jgi:hypothetical protein
LPKIQKDQLKQLTRYIFLLLITSGGYAQGILNKTVSVNIIKQPLSSVLDNISRQGNFHFSYIRDFVSDDSLVTVKATNKTVKQVLDMLFQGNCQYKEIGNQLVLQRAVKEKWYFVSGYITDATTGKPVSNASVYERMQLISTLTNEQGYFKFRLKERERITAISVSKELYKDTAMVIISGHDQELTAGLKPASAITLSVVDVNQYSHVEQTRLGRLFLSSRQRIQSLNLNEFFTKQPYQGSIVPGAGTHGKLGSQVVNKLSLNMIGGYTAGLNGVELAGIFNIDQKNVQYVQAAGIFNIVGGKMRGFQAAGLYNQVLDSVVGMQAASVGNVSDTMVGFQAGGIFNYTKSLNGLQAASIINISKGTARGMQASAGVNYAKKIDGVQAGVVNYTGKLQGVQVGVINIADTSDGYSIGVLNIVRKNGYHQVSVSNNELTDLNITWKSGNHKLYTILMAGMSLRNNEKAYAFGAGMGHTFRISKTTDIQAEIISQTLYLGSWEYTTSLTRFQPVLNIHLSKFITLYGGPAFTVSYQDAGATPVPGYKSVLNKGFKLGDNAAGWFGWHLGIGFF